MRFIDEATIATVLQMDELIPAMRQAMIDFSRGRITQPQRQMTEVRPHGGFFGSMPAVSANALGAKLVAFYPGNDTRDLHTYMATSSTEPVLRGHWLRPGARVASVGWAGRDGAELDAETMSHVVDVDSREAALAESGNVRHFDAEIYAELGEVFDGDRPLAPDATVVFDSIGMACQDLVAGALVYEKLDADGRTPHG